MNSRRPIVWTIAGSDSGGGAGIQGDIKTLFDLGAHGCSVITAITAQNTTGVHASLPVDANGLEAQLAALAADLPPRAIKIGQLPTADSVDVVVRFLAGFDGFTVADPVLRATGGFELGDAEAAAAIPRLFPHLSLLTPNLSEAERLTDMRIESARDVVRAAEALIRAGCRAVLIKGGHGRDDWCQDYYLDRDGCREGETGGGFWLSHRRSANANTHGTGCMLSSACAAFIAHGKALRDALVLAHAYVQRGIRLATPIVDGGGVGPVVQAGWPDRLEDFPEVGPEPGAHDLAPFAKCDTHSLGLYPIVDSIEWLERLLPAGVRTIQLRIKDQPVEILDPLVARAAELGRRFDARLFINDYWELAIEHRAYGVHLGQQDLDVADLGAIRRAGLRLGISTHSEYEWARAVTCRPSYIALGTVFPTKTKPAILIGTQNLRRWVPILETDYPLTAIGGITPANVDAVLASGIRSIAVATAITEADDYLEATRKLIRSLAA